MSAPKLKLVACIHRYTTIKCKEPVVGWRVNKDGERFLFCEAHYHLLEMTYCDDSMGRFKTKKYKSVQEYCDDNEYDLC